MNQTIPIVAIMNLSKIYYVIIHFRHKHIYTSTLCRPRHKYISQDIIERSLFGPLLLSTILFSVSDSSKQASVSMYHGAGPTLCYRILLRSETESFCDLKGLTINSGALEEDILCLLFT